MQWGEKTHTHTHTKVTVFNSAQCHTLVSITASLTKEFGPNTNQSPSITTWREKFAGQKWVAVNIWTLCHKVFTICSHRMKGVGEGEGGQGLTGEDPHVSLQNKQRVRITKPFRQHQQSSGGGYSLKLLNDIDLRSLKCLFLPMSSIAVFFISVTYWDCFIYKCCFFFSLSLFHLKIWVRMHVSWFFCVLGTIITMLEYFTVKWGKHVFWGGLHLHAVQSNTVLEIDHFESPHCRHSLHKHIVIIWK